MGDPAALTELRDRYAGPEAQALYDEAVTELDHGLQCAALAEAEGAEPALVAAALLHDVGHLVVGDLAPIDEELTRDFHHERAGATYLARWFGPEVTEPVRLHVAAKRYLCAIDPGYHASLTPSSVRSLDVQGGPMSDDEATAFAAQAASDAAVRVRRWDDRGKVDGLDVAPFDHYLPLLESLLA